MAIVFQDSVIVQGLIQKSECISEGPPAQYHLISSHQSNLDETVSVRKRTFGKKDVNIPNKILLMVGETGTGKTTLINAMVNYIHGVKFTDEVWFKITEEEGDNHMSDQSKSRNEITVYEIYVESNPICLTIIDTPGYGDTRGRVMDKQMSENLYKLFHSDTGVKEIDAVCLVVKASETRLSDRQYYIFDAVLSLFGKDIENNIFMFITHSDGMPPEDALSAYKKAGIPCRKNEEGQLEHFLFNNLQTKKRNTKYNRALQTAWEQTEDSLKLFFASVKEQNRKSLKQTESVLTESKRLEACLTNLQSHIEFVDGKTKELAQTQKALEENQEKIRKYENLHFTVTKYLKEKVPIENSSWWDKKATTCSVCEENCHEYGCWSAWNPRWCSFMKNGHCTVCTGKCHYTKHVREDKKYVTYGKEDKITFDQLKEQYEGSCNSASDMRFDSKYFENVKNDIEGCKKQEKVDVSKESRIKEELLDTEKVKADLVEEAYTAIVKLSEIALKPDSAFIVQALDFLIPQAEETGKDGVQKLRELRKILPESQARVNVVMEYATVTFNRQKS